MEKEILRVENLKKYFTTKHGTLHAVDNVSFSINQGNTLGIVGESGCGKSTLGRSVIRLLEPKEGKVIFNGEDVIGYSNKRMREIRKEMQIIFQDPYASLDPRMTVGQIISEPLIINTKMKKRKRNARVFEIMDTVGLARNLITSYPHELDGGRRQRIGIARALSLNPKFIVCDEPVSALDVSIQAQILNLMQDLQEKLGLTYMFITHDLSVVKHISTEIAVMYLGEIVEKAPTEELFNNPLHPYTKALLSAIPIPSLHADRKKITLMRGEITSPINPTPGCRFKNRCPNVKCKCGEKKLELIEVIPRHFVACYAYK